MQIIKNKKVWFFLLLGVMAVTTVYLWRSGIKETKAYANGRVVDRHTEEKDVATGQWQGITVETKAA